MRFIKLTETRNNGNLPFYVDAESVVAFSVNVYGGRSYTVVHLSNGMHTEVKEDPETILAMLRKK